MLHRDFMSSKALDFYEVNQKSNRIMLHVINELETTKTKGNHSPQDITDKQT